MWLHARCLEEQASRIAHEQHITEGDRSVTTLEFEAKLVSSDTSITRLIITDQDNLQQDVDILCLECGKIIEKASKAGGDSSKQTIFQAPVAKMIGHTLGVKEMLGHSAIGKTNVAKPPVSNTATVAPKPVEDQSGKDWRSDWKSVIGF
jgi:hypothetical protein